MRCNFCFVFFILLQSEIFREAWLSRRNSRPFNLISSLTLSKSSILKKLKDFTFFQSSEVNVKNVCLIHLANVDLNHVLNLSNQYVLIRDHPSLWWSGATFWEHFSLDNGLKLGYSAVASSTQRVHNWPRAHTSLIRGHFGLGQSDQRSLLSKTVWSEAVASAISTWVSRELFIIGEMKWEYISIKPLFNNRSKILTVSYISVKETYHIFYDTKKILKIFERPFLLQFLRSTKWAVVWVVGSHTKNSITFEIIWACINWANNTLLILYSKNNMLLKRIFKGLLWNRFILNFDIKVKVFSKIYVFTDPFLKNLSCLETINLIHVSDSVWVWWDLDLFLGGVSIWNNDIWYFLRHSHGKIFRFFLALKAMRWISIGSELTELGLYKW